MDITINELIAALEAAQARPETEDGITTRELRAATGWSEKRITGLLGALKGEGRLGVRQVYRQTLNGRISPVPGYVLLSPKQEDPAD